VLLSKEIDDISALFGKNINDLTRLQEHPWFEDLLIGIDNLHNVKGFLKRITKRIKAWSKEGVFNLEMFKVRKNHCHRSSTAFPVSHTLCLNF
jgi:hypothetical protein